jgi:hypothetical protein
MDAEHSQDVLQEEEGGKDLMSYVAHEMIITISNDLYTLLQPYASKTKNIDSDKPVSLACHDIYKKYKRGKKFTDWVRMFIAYLHQDFITDQVLYKLWRNNNGRIE